MEQPLTIPLQAEVEAPDGRIVLVRLLAYLGDDRWRGVDGARQELIVAAHQIRYLEQAA